MSHLLDYIEYLPELHSNNCPMPLVGMEEIDVGESVVLPQYPSYLHIIDTRVVKIRSHQDINRDCAVALVVRSSARSLFGDPRRSIANCRTS